MIDQPGISINIANALRKAEPDKQHRYFDPAHQLCRCTRAVISNGSWMLWAPSPKDPVLHKMLQAMLREHAGAGVSVKASFRAVPDYNPQGSFTVDSTVPDFSAVAAPSGFYHVADETNLDIRGKAVVLKDSYTSFSRVEWLKESLDVVTAVDPKPPVTADTAMNISYYAAFRRLGLHVLLREGGSPLDPMLLAKDVGRGDLVGCGTCMPMRL